LCHASAGYSQLLAEPAVGDLEAPHGRSVPFGIVGGRGTVFAFELGKIRGDFVVAGISVRLRIDLALKNRDDRGARNRRECEGSIRCWRYRTLARPALWR
jgi:hypothetical protein